METQVASLEDVPGAFLSVGAKAFLLLLLVGLVLAIGVGTLALSVAANGFNWLSLALLVGALTGLLAMVIVLMTIRQAISSLREYFDFERDRIRQNQDALLREREPQPYTVVDRPILVNKHVAAEAPETINGVPMEAVSYFVAQLCRGVSHAQSRWDRFLLPGDFEIASFEAYDKLLTPLVELGIITGRDGDKRKTGVLTSHDPDLIMARLREWEARPQSHSNPESGSRG
jgi:hypothetical protein